MRLGMDRLGVRKGEGMGFEMELGKGWNGKKRGNRTRDRRWDGSRHGR